MRGRFLLICNRARKLDTALGVLSKNSNVIERTTNCLRKIYVLALWVDLPLFFQFSNGRILNAKITARLKKVKKTLVLILVGTKVLDDRGVHCVFNVIFSEAKTISSNFRCTHTYREHHPKKLYFSFFIKPLLSFIHYLEI